MSLASYRTIRMNFLFRSERGAEVCFAICRRSGGDSPWQEDRTAVEGNYLEEVP